MKHEFVTNTLKRVRYAHHCEFLTQCLSHKVVPKGMHINLKINAPGKPSSSFQNRLLGIQKKASFDSMHLLLSRNQSIIKQIDTSLKKLRVELENQTNSDIANDVFAEANQYKSKLYNRLHAKRSKKLKGLGIHRTSECQASQSGDGKLPRSRRFKRTTRQTDKQATNLDSVVVNLSSAELTESEKSLLSKGLNFCPRPKSYDKGKLVEDTKAFTRRMRLKSHFADRSDSRSQEKYPDFIPKSDWQPPKQGRDLEAFVNRVESAVRSHIPPKPKHDNLSKSDRSALYNLQKREDIVIKPADKGSAVVVMDRDQYVSEAERQLNDSTFYKPLDHDPTPEFAKQVSDTVSEMHDQGLISEKNMAYLIVDQPKAGRFYLLPKIHKAGNPGRPIVSANGHPTEKISEFVDLHLQSHVQTLPSYLQDTTDFLKKQESLGPIPSDALLVSMDVTSLYTNIPHSDGIKACEEAWDERDIKDPPTQTLVKLLTLVLKCNNFEFNGQHYLQVQGTAMGTKMAPAYANMFMGRLEKQLLMSVTMRPFSWLRFIDDIDMKWLHGHDNLDTFLQEANSFHSTIRFTAEVSNDKHVFLDTQSRLDEDRISTDLYTKPTDTHQYLLPTSCHPKHCCKNIPFSLALRLRRICSDSNTFELRAKELTNQLHRRGYLKQDIASAIDKARQRSRDALLSYRPKSAEVGTIVPFVLTYHPDLPKVRDIVDKNWSIIESSDELKDIYQSKPVMAFRRPKSLRDFLVRARLKPNSGDDNQTGECRPCGRKRCQCCKMITSAGTVKSSSGATVRLRQNTDCTTENVVYLISCSSCNKQYVGETKGPLNKRMNGHRDDWRHRRFERSPTAEHFHSADHDFLSNASVCCLEHNKEWSDSTRKLRESYWIRRLNTLCPFGINKGD